MPTERVIVATCEGVPLVFADLDALRTYARTHRHPEHYNELQTLAGIVDLVELEQGIPLIGFGYAIRSCVVQRG